MLDFRVRNQLKKKAFKTLFSHTGKDDTQFLFIDSVTNQTDYNVTIESLSSGTFYFVEIQALYEAGSSNFGRSSNTVTSKKHFHPL